jgi:hypothetical protein
MKSSKTKTAGGGGTPEQDAIAFLHSMLELAERRGLRYVDEEICWARWPRFRGGLSGIGGDGSRQNPGSSRPDKNRSRFTTYLPS